jgi:E3 ubiquitin-protein ligase RAD18
MSRSSQNRGNLVTDPVEDDYEDVTTEYSGEEEVIEETGGGDRHSGARDYALLRVSRLTYPALPEEPLPIIRPPPGLYNPAQHFGPPFSPQFRQQSVTQFSLPFGPQYGGPVPGAFYPQFSPAYYAGASPIGQPYPGLAHYGFRPGFHTGQPLSPNQSAAILQNVATPRQTPREPCPPAAMASPSPPQPPSPLAPRLAVAPAKPALPTVDDPSDFASTPAPLLGNLDHAMRCQVCKDFFDTPMITSCSHTFCSMCIRQALSTDGRCPTCRQEDQPSKLRINWAVQEVAASWKKVRGVVLGQLRGETEKEEGEAEERPRKRTRTMAPPPPPAQPAPSRDGEVPCPVCALPMQASMINDHLDKCLAIRPPSTPSAPPSLTVNRSRALPTVKNPHTPNTYQNQQNRLPFIHFASYKKDADLRKKLASLGIPTAGTRQRLERRHTYWVNLWNSNLDAGKAGKSQSQLLEELAAWDRGRTAEENGASLAGLNGQPVMSRAFDGGQWSVEHSDHFGDLIATARAGVRRKREEEDARAREEQRKREKREGETK